MDTSQTKEKVLVLVGTIGAGVSGYLLALGKPAEAALAGTVSAAIVGFWSERVNVPVKD